MLVFVFVFPFPFEFPFEFPLAPDVVVASAAGVTAEGLVWLPPIVSPSSSPRVARVNCAVVDAVVVTALGVEVAVAVGPTVMTTTGACDPLGTPVPVTPDSDSDSPVGVELDTAGGAMAGADGL